MTTPVTLDMSTAKPIQSAPVTLDMSTAKALPGAMPTYAQASQEAQAYIGGGANLLVGSEGIKDITKGAVGLGEAAAPYVSKLLENPKVKPVVDLIEKEVMKVPGADTVKAAWGVLKPWLSGELPGETVRPAPPLPEGFEPAKPQYEPPTGTATNPQKISTPMSAEPTPPPPVDISRKAVGSAVDQSLNVQPLKPNVPLREQIPAKAQPAVEPKASSAVQSHSYDPDAKEMQVTPKSNPNITYVYGDVAPDQAALFDSGSKGQAWKALRDSSSAPVAKIINGKRIPVKPMNRLATASPDDLTDVLQQSVQAVKKNRLAASAAAD